MPTVDDLPVETETDGTRLKCWHDAAHGRYKTSVSRVAELESNTLYWGDDPETAIEVYEECLERFDIGAVDSVDDIEWSS